MAHEKTGVSCCDTNYFEQSYDDFFQHAKMLTTLHARDRVLSEVQQNGQPAMKTGMAKKKSTLRRL